MIHLILLALAAISFLIPSGWKLSPEFNFRIFLVFLAIFFIIYITGILASLRHIDSHTVFKITRRYGFYFQFPNASCFISKLAVIFQILLMINCLLAYNFVGVIISLLTYTLCVIIRLVCNPVFFAEEGIRKFYGKPESTDFINKLRILSYVYEHIYGREPPLPK